MVGNRSGQGHIEKKVLDPKLSLRERLIKAKAVLLKQFLGLVIHPAFFLRAGIRKFVAAKLSGQNSDRNSILLKEQEHGTRRILVPSRRELYRPSHDPVGIQQIVQLLIEILDFVRNLSRADVHIAKDRIDRVLGLYAVALQRCLQLPSHDGARHIQKGVLKQFLVI